MVIWFDIAGLPMAQGVALDISLQVTKSPFINPAVENVLLLGPTGELFKYH
jgi:hypothetical protein